MFSRDGNSSRIIDKNTGIGVGGAQITLLKERYSTKTDVDGFLNWIPILMVRVLCLCKKKTINHIQ